MYLIQFQAVQVVNEMIFLRRRFDKVNADNSLLLNFGLSNET